MQIRQFLKEIMTLKTVWIDKGQGKWTVKKRLHPFLQGVIAVIILAAGVGVYMSFPVVSNIHKAEAESSPEKLKVVAKVAKAAEQKPVAMKRESITIPTSNNDTIISEPEKLFKPVTQPIETPDDGNYKIFVSKSNYTLSLFKGNSLVKEYPIAIGKNPGDKRRVGDHRTPVGDFKIVSIEASSTWKHDFGDGKGKIAGAYGPWFLRLDAKGWKGIGIHGTHDPDSRGTMATEGCIRLSNEDIAELRSYAYRNMPVIIREN